MREGGTGGGTTAGLRIRAGIAALLRGERLHGEPPGPACAPGSTLLDVPGAELLEIGGERVFSVRRDVAELLPGTDFAAELGAALERLRARDPAEVPRGLRPAIGRDLADLAVLDLETTGFWGCPVFLVGILALEGGRLVTRQLLARDYPEEARILRGAGRLLAGRKLLVTFNGKSYDAPCLRERCGLHGVTCALDRLAHVDVLHPARGLWRGRFADCRLATLERSVLGMTRAGDLASAEVPAAYHAFAASPDPERLRPILRHGRVDLVATARLFARLAGGPVPAEDPEPLRR
jgi:hypothetical protein